MSTFASSPRPRHVLAVGAASLTLTALAASWAAGQQEGALTTVAVVFAPVALLALVARPDLLPAVLGGLVVANAGLVLSESVGVPNVVRGLTVVALASFLLLPGHRRAALRWTPILVAFALFAEARVLSALAAPGGADAAGAAKDLVYGGALVVALTALGSSPPALRRGIEAVVATSSLLVGLTTLRVLGYDGTFGGFAADVLLTPEEREAALRSLEAVGDTYRVAGPVADPNYWAQALVLVFPLALWLTRTGSSPAARVAGGAGAVAIGIGILETQSRGGLIALGVAVAVWLWLQGGRWRSSIPILAVAGAITVLAAPGTADRVRSLEGLANPAHAEDAALRGRYSEALAAVHMFRDHPILGIGTGQYPPNYRSYATRIGIDARPEREPHSSYLEMAAESGLAGLLAFVALLGAAAWAGLDARRRLRERDPRSAGAADALVAGLTGYATAALFLHQAFPEYLWLALGLTSAVYVLSRARRT
jgi:putative inorganic carbon (hco3(-)) transporter